METCAKMCSKNTVLIRKLIKELVSKRLRTS